MFFPEFGKQKIKGKLSCSLIGMNIPKKGLFETIYHEFRVRNPLKKTRNIY